MCGIAGIFSYASAAPSVNQTELRAIRDHMSLRGPDGSGEWFSQDGRVGLGHRRLAIIDLSERAAQPMASGDGRYLITFNGEIYNYHELRRSLEANGRTFVSDSDTEVLLQLYAAKGEAMLGELRGMFAFAIWDTVSHTLFAARDAFGIKPLYFADDGKTLRFASQVKALLQGNVDASPEPAGHVGFFLWGSVPAPWTLFRGIRALPAGHFLRVTANGRCEQSEWTSVRRLIQDAENQTVSGSIDEALEAISDSIHDSVKAHMIADVPVGVFLSSGLDSCMLAACAAEMHHDVQAVTLGFNEFAGTPDDEVPLARQIAAAFGVRHDVFTVSKSDFVSQRAALLAAMDQPSIDGVNTWFVARAAAQSGLKVVLSGLGGDELFGSYPSFTDVPRMQRLAMPFAALPGVGRAVRKVCAPIASRMSSPKFASVLEYGGTFGGAYFLRRALMMPWELTTILDRDVVNEGLRLLNVPDGMAPLTNGIRSPRFRVSALEMQIYMRHQLLRDSDWASMAHSVELRVPFVDSKLIADAIPWLQAVPGLTKTDVARRVAPKVSKRVWNRPKTGFSVPVRDWILVDLPRENARGLRGWANRVFRVQTAQNPATISRVAFDDRFVRPLEKLGQRTPRVLIASIAPGSGGVNSMVEFVLTVLREEGYEPVIAHYQPYSISPLLSVPSFSLLSRVVDRQVHLTHGDVETHAIGAWLPELEFTHYQATTPWREVMDSCDAFVVVSGNNLACTAFFKTKRPYVAWIASDWHGDRAERAARFSPPRRVLDRIVNGPVIQRLERKLLGGGVILPLSRHTKGQLERILAGCTSSIFPAPIDLDRFAPCPEKTVFGRIGFAGRFDDPRKNIELLLDAFVRVSSRFTSAELYLIGAVSTPAIDAQIARRRLQRNVVIVDRLTGTDYPDALQRLDVFVVPSHQEGLCIAALEAMASGVPVVSTRCGGPEEFVLDGQTGALCAFDATEMADQICEFVSDRVLRDRIGAAARQHIVKNYGPQHGRRVFLDGFYRAFPGLVRSG